MISEKTFSKFPIEKELKNIEGLKKYPPNSLA